jgi:epoxyqueuosine reductase
LFDAFLTPPQAGDGRATSLMRESERDRISDAAIDGEHQTTDWTALRGQLTRWASELGFQSVGVSGTDLSEAETYLARWLDEGRHGEMGYMAKHGTARTRPAELVPGTVRVITVRMDYWPDDARDPWDTLGDASSAYVSRYALGRDYHKLMRNRLQQLATRIEEHVGSFGYRAFVDSAPVMEKPLSAKAGLGWMGKHTNLLTRDAGSWYFLGELYTDLPLAPDGPVSSHCGHCTACIDACPTKAIVAPFELDARLCISYLTIEHHGSIPAALRPAIGNRIFGCDDCQLVCPWNRFATPSQAPQHVVRNGLDNAALTDLFGWTADEFERRTRGSAIRRIGHVRWLRNIAVALGNAPTTRHVVHALSTRQHHPNELVREHVTWALAQHTL